MGKKHHFHLINGQNDSIVIIRKSLVRVDYNVRDPLNGNATMFRFNAHANLMIEFLYVNLLSALFLETAKEKM